MPPASRAFVLAALIATAACHRHPGPRAFVSNEDDGTVTVIDAQSYQVVTTIAVGKRPRGLRVSPDGKRLYVALSGSPKAGPGVSEASLPPPDRAADGIGVIDLDDLHLERTLTSGQDPESFDLVGDHRLAVSNEETAQASLIDTETGKLAAQVPTGREPEGVTTAPDHTVWVTSETDHRISVIDPDEDREVASIEVGDRPRSIAFTPDGKRAVISNENDASLTIADVATRRPLGRLTVGPDAGAAVPPRPMGIAIARDGARGYVTLGRAGSVAVLDLHAPDATGARVIGAIHDVGKRPWGIAIAPSGLLFTANGPSNDVSVIDPARGKVVARVAAGRSPWGIAIAP
ncbi:MAG TPA: hypothetical protein VFP84_38185 [Kofleriaceae bacterium]|nr:hypothetical protein [Kofleriaceae bacterium]